MVHPLPLMRTHLRKSLHGRYFPMARLLIVPAMLALSACAAQAAAIQSYGWNLIGVGNGIASFTQTGNQAGLTSAQVKLNGAANNGGPLRTCLPRQDSPARNADDLGIQPIGWQTLLESRADPQGQLRIIDPPQRFYRAAFP